MSTRSSILLISAVVIAFYLPLFYVGIPDEYDLMQHMRFADEYRLAILSGEMIPKWGAQDNFGFGSIGIRYYPPVPYILLAVLRILGTSWFVAYCLTSLFWVSAGCFGMYAWIREWSSSLAATIAAISYAVIPFQPFEIYQAILYSEFVAAGVVPYCFWFLTRLLRSRRGIDVILFSLAYSILILTHIPTAIMASGAMVLYGLIVTDWRHVGRTIISLVTAGALTAFATAFHLAKAVPEVDWVQHNSSRFFTRGFYDYRSYVFPLYLSSPDWLYDGKALWHFDLITFLTLVFFTTALYVFIAYRGGEVVTLRSKIGVGLIAGGGSAFFMLSVASLNIWNGVALLQKIQFPWRWLVIASVLSSALFGLAAPTLLFRKGKFTRFTAYPIIVLFLVTILFDVTQSMVQSAPLSADKLEAKVGKMYDEAACECWWPIWANAEALGQRNLDAGTRPASYFEHTETERRILVDPGASADLRVPVFYHPYWKAHVNGSPVIVGHDKDGAIVVPLAAQSAHVELSFVEPSYLSPARYLSLFTWVTLTALVGLWLFYRRRSAHADAGNDPTSDTQQLTTSMENTVVLY